MLAPAAHVYEPGLCPNKYQQHAENRNKYTTAHHGLLDHENQEKNNASIMAVISAVLLECVLAPEKAR